MLLLRALIVRDKPQQIVLQSPTLSPVAADERASALEIVTRAGLGERRSGPSAHTAHPLHSADQTDPRAWFMGAKDFLGVAHDLHGVQSQLNMQ